ncbi:TetR/AcrR family transcriptional regulator [Vibrio fluvialis]|jgi:AcrR family transcriptional regulator|uniref:Transcriptional regulator n=2 Tax=Vibrio TaxID=662 RepID=A0AAX2LJS7_VIBFL|nr:MULTISPECIES: TetR/AcrR family transcriptional regulator [Vibrio]TNF18119.1 MAG: TetR/AcrR family transcriptional regulator [Vibrionaceae bacterium]HDM8033751.1 TetR/AcrR family transcriptional regulator [Vibrio fluvialis clinical-1]AMF93455.1 TetR/AcrR family transcriptional regulator [Vibrio fluvialis]AVH32074.1 TetR/AcrR family transcriptional regulator [Vibrio fluvialis]EKO3383519.1 TetR/AcrR family transcriptional regulator [Vibrio fluvialis]
MSTRKAGRPQQPTDVRELLLQHAKELFTVMDYDKVSTRLIAQKAQVDIGMIRYYFGSKGGLFETMLRETLAPMKEQIDHLLADSNHQNLTEVMRTYYREMIKVPHFPRLIMQVMQMPPSELQRQLIEKVILDVTKPVQDMMFQKLIQRGVVRPDVDPQLCRVSYISLMVFPFIAPRALLAVHGIELNEEFLDRLIEHNIRLMEQGFLIVD